MTDSLEKAEKRYRNLKRLVALQNRFVESLLTPCEPPPKKVIKIVEYTPIYQVAVDTFNQLFRATPCFSLNGRQFTEHQMSQRQSGWNKAIDFLLPHLYNQIVVNEGVLDTVIRLILSHPFDKECCIKSSCILSPARYQGKDMNLNSSVNMRAYMWQNAAQLAGNPLILENNVDSFETIGELLLELRRKLFDKKLTLNCKEETVVDLMQKYKVLDLLFPLKMVNSKDSNLIRFNTPKIFDLLQDAIFVLEQLYFDTRIDREDYHELTLNILELMNDKPSDEMQENRKRLAQLVFLLIKQNRYKVGNGRFIRMITWFFACKWKLIENLDLFSRDFWMALKSNYQLDADGLWCKHELPLLKKDLELNYQLQTQLQSNFRTYVFTLRPGSSIGLYMRPNVFSHLEQWFTQAGVYWLPCELMSIFPNFATLREAKEFKKAQKRECC